MREKNNIEVFESLPRRIFLDSCTLQNIQTYGENIFDNIEVPINDKNARNVEALRNIFFVNQRANFEFALSDNSIKEVLDKGDKSYLQWAFDVLDHWMCCIEEYEKGEAFSRKGEMLLKQLNSKQFGYLSEKDKALIFDAVLLECDTFLTMDLKLCTPKNSEHIWKMLKIRILQPYEYWEILKPFARLWV